MYTADNHNTPYQLQTLRNKIRLSDGERKAMYYELEKTKRINEECIQLLRDDIAELNKLKSKNKRIADNTYNRLLRDKQLAKAYKNKNIQEILVEIEHQVFENRRKLDLLLYKKNHILMKLKKLAEDESRELTRTTEEPTVTTESMKLRELESKLAQVKIKSQEARYITQKYRKIKEKLNQEQLQYKQQMDVMENEINLWINEKKEIREIHDTAIKLRDDMITDIANFEISIRKLKSRFEKESKEKKNLQKEERNQVVQALKKKSVPYSSRMWEEVLSQIKNPAQVASEERELALHISLFDLIKDKTGISNPGEIINLSRTQSKTSELLKEKEITLSSQLASKRQETEELEKTLQELKFSESKKYADTFDRIEELKEKIEITRKIVNNKMEEVDRIKSVNVNFRQVLEELARKLDLNQDFVNSQSESSLENTLNLLNLCIHKMQTLQQEFDKINSNDIMTQSPSPPPETEEEETPEKFTSDDLAIDYNKFLTRNVVKQMSKQITTSHAKMKKQMHYNPDYTSQKQRKSRSLKPTT